MGNAPFVAFYGTAQKAVYDKFQVGDTVSWSGWANAGNNDTGDKVLEKSSRSIYFKDLLGVSAHRTVYCWQTSQDKVYEDIGGPIGFSGFYPGQSALDITVTGTAASEWASNIQRSGSPTIHMGNNTTPDSHMDGKVADLPAFKDMAYVVFNSLALEDFGHRIPNFEFVVSAHPDLREVKGVMESILGEAELEASAYDCSGVSTTEVVGYTSRGPTETAKRLQPIMLAFNVVAQERGGVLYFFDRSAAKAWTIDTADIGASSGKPTGGVEVRQTPSTEKYGEVTVAFINSDPDSNDLYGASSFAQGMERAQSMSASNIQGRQSPARWSKLAVNLPITMTSDSARRIAYRLLHTTQSDDLMFTLTLPPKYMQIRENDRISFSAGGNSYKAMVQKVDIGAQNIVKIEASLDVAVDMDFDEW
jgi:hypothetical protein